MAHVGQELTFRLVRGFGLLFSALEQSIGLGQLGSALLYPPFQFIPSVIQPMVLRLRLTRRLLGAVAQDGAFTVHEVRYALQIKVVHAGRLVFMVVARSSPKDRYRADLNPCFKAMLMPKNLPLGEKGAWTICGYTSAP